MMIFTYYDTKVSPFRFSVIFVCEAENENDAGAMFKNSKVKKDVYTALRIEPSEGRKNWLFNWWD
jgi:hypothetical protein